MRKNLNKIIAFAIGVSVAGGSVLEGNVLSAMAADKVDTETMANTVTQAKAEKKVLTADDAAKTAVANSDTLQLLDKQIKLTEDMNRLNDRIDDVSDLTDLKEDYNDDSRKLKLDQLKQKREFSEDKLIQTTKDSFNSLVLNKVEIDKIKNDIQINERSLNENKLKQNLGLVTSIQIEQLELSLQQAKNNLTTKEDSFKNAKLKFKSDTGIDVDDYILDDTLDYKKFELSGDLDAYIDGIIDEFLSYSDEIYELDKEYWNDDDNKVKAPTKPSKDELNQKGLSVEDYLKDKTTPDEKIDALVKYMNDSSKYQSSLSIYMSQLSARMAYLQQKYGLDATEVQLSEARKEYKNALRNMYASLKSSEAAIDLLQENIEYENKQIRLAKVNYDLGLMTKLNYDTKVNALEANQVALRNYVNSYNSLKAKFEKPWIAFS